MSRQLIAFAVSFRRELPAEKTGRKSEGWEQGLFIRTSVEGE